MKSLLPSLRVIGVSLAISIIIGTLGYFVLGAMNTSIENAARYQTYILMAGALLGALTVQIIHIFNNRPTEVVSLFIGNLPFRASNQQLRQVFSKHGTVHNLRLMTDKVTRKPRGFGFVEMDKHQAKIAVKELNGYEFMGRELKVNYANESKY
ncbi:hypothetical protein MNBD_GAMMA23-283 [hydrothermal vent metagenome]|uniref:RRM domain-containing protein n=1 Tax=hydrothermal vent metagenome TaxID=652676 RepID=A0A3B1AED7_9ZZZZ